MRSRLKSCRCKSPQHYRTQSGQDRNQYIQQGTKCYEPNGTARNEKHQMNRYEMLPAHPFLPCLLLSVTARYCPLLPVTGRYCPLRRPILQQHPKQGSQLQKHVASSLQEVPLPLPLPLLTQLPYIYICTFSTEA